MKMSRWRFCAERHFAMILITVSALAAFCCKSASREEKEAHGEHFEKALQNAEQANTGFVRSKRYLDAWLAEADPETKLVPRRLYGPDGDIWNAQDCAADNYPFLVLTSFFTSREWYTGLTIEMLHNEIRLTSRLKSLPDTYSFSKDDFAYDSISTDRVVFGASEYMKDGLLPLTEWLGPTPWSERMTTMLTDMDKLVNVAEDFSTGGIGDSPTAEVNGELLQVLSRMYWMTGNASLLDWAVQIGDHFLLGAGYPLRTFDYLKLRDHGCELVAGLCELYITLHFADKQKQEAYRQPLYDLLDYVLKYGRNPDGFFYNAINPQNGQVVGPGLADTWGYTLNGFYGVYMLDSVPAYGHTVTTVFENLEKYHHYDWENGGADGYADAIEGALNLYNRVPDERAARWIDEEIRVMWSMQDSSHRENAQQWKGSGIIEGWYGDGNFARTTIMYNLWKSKGTHVHPWNAGVRLGAEMKGDTLFVAVVSSASWDGRLHFDRQRHRINMNLPIDWPRINQFPEWYTISPAREYDIARHETGDTRRMKGSELLNGIALHLEPNEIRKLMITLAD